MNGDVADQGLLIETQGALRLLTISRVRQSNAVDAATSHAIDRALRDAESDASIGAVILTGAGERSFCAGMDMKEAARIGFGHGLVPGRGFCGLTNQSFAKPIIAAVNGAAVAGGLELALACDIVIASDTATFGLSEVKRGLVAFAGGVQRLAQRAPRSLALEIILTGAPISARRLCDVGIVSRVVPAARLMDEAIAMGEALLANSWTALNWSKELFDRAADLPLQASLALGDEFGARLRAVAASGEGIAAFAQKRAARFNAAP